jgi:hypothetical protein
MKKLMITAAVAAMVGSAFAVGKAQVYDYTATIKTSACRATKLSNKLVSYFNANRILPSAWNTFGLETGDEIGIRKQVSVKIAGVIWGCDCVTISLPGWRLLDPDGDGRGYLGGYYFWNQQTQRIYNPWRTSFSWNVLNRIDTMTKCEGSYMLFCSQAGQRIFVFGGGFGTVAKTGCDTYIKSMSGNLSGFTLLPPDAFGCVLCGGNNCVVSTLCDLCWDIFDPGFVDTTALSAVSGTWKLKYNSSATKRISSTPWISRIYNFKKGGNTSLVATWIDRVWAANMPGISYGADAEVDWDRWEEFAEYHVGANLEEFVDPEDDSVEKPDELASLMEEWDSDQEAASEEDDDGFTGLISRIAAVLADLS